MADAPSQTPAGDGHDTILEVRNLCKVFTLTKGFLRRKVGEVRAVDDVTFTVRRGEVFGLVGESGCGKTTAARCILRAIEPTSGHVVFHPVRNDGGVDVTTLDAAALRDWRRRARMIFQDPYSSLNPRMNIRQIIAEPLRINGVAHGRADLEERVAAVLEQVGLDRAAMRRYPHAFSGGQRQRLVVARALVLDPEFVIADEPVSALDVSVQAQILNLLQHLQRRLGLTYLFIAHNLAVVEHISDRVGVMYAGRLVELGDTRDLYRRPRHPYTEALLAAVPRAEPGRHARRRLLRGEVADPANLPPGCLFHPRCRHARDICKSQSPPLRKLDLAEGAPRYAACHFADELDLEGVTPE